MNFEKPFGNKMYIEMGPFYYPHTKVMISSNILQLYHVIFSFEQKYQFIPLKFILECKSCKLFF